MKKINKSAKVIDTILKMAQVILKVCIVAIAICLTMIGICKLTGESNEWILENFDTALEFQDLSLTISDSYMPSANKVVLLYVTMMSLVIVVSVIGISLLKSLRLCLEPVIKGLPFNTSVADNLKIASIKTIILGISLTIIESVEYFMTLNIYKLPELLLSDKITDVVINYRADLSFLITALVFYMLSCVCRYGVELQQQVDETL